MDTPEQPKPTFDPNQPHMNRPKLRPVRGFPLQAEGPDGEQRTMLGLADAKQISPQIVATAPAFQQVLPKMDGQRGIDQIVQEIGGELTRDVLEQFIAQLDNAALIEGPTFDALYEDMRQKFDQASDLPPGKTAEIADQIVAAKVGEDVTDEDKAEQGPKLLADIFDQWIDQALEKADDPSFDSLPKVLVAPHSDYPRAWPNYAAAWGRMRVVERPDRIVILGTNHFGLGKGVVGCDKGYQTPFGLCPADQQLIESLRQKLGDQLFEHRYDHEREHSIELQIPWIQHCLGADDNGEFCKVFGVLVHDPAVNNGDAYDNDGIGLNPFIDALKSALAELGGTTLIVCSAEFSHVGAAFGDQPPAPLNAQTPEADQYRNQVIQRDQELIELVVQLKPDDLVGSMAWQQNPTRWNSTGAVVASIKVAEPAEGKLLNFAAAIDPQGYSLITTAAIAMF